VTSYASQDKTVSAAMQDTFPAMVDWYTYKGKLMGIPWDFSAGTVMYNLDQLRAANLTPINDLGKSWDWNMMKDYAGKLAQKNGATMTRSGIWINSGTENGWYSFCVANGASFLNYLALRPHLDNSTRGVIQIKDVVYYLSITGVALFLSTLSLETRRWR